MVSLNSSVKSSRSDGYQIILFAIAIVGAGILLIYFPDPKPLISAPLPDNLVVIDATIVVPSGKVTALYPLAGANVSFRSIGTNGEISKYELKTKTGNNGFAQIRLYVGTYVVKVADWTPQKIVIINDSILSIKRFEIEDTPNIRIIATSKDWEVAPHDLMEVSYTNQLSKPVLLHGITFGMVPSFRKKASS